MRMPSLFLSRKRITTDFRNLQRNIRCRTMACSSNGYVDMMKQLKSRNSISYAAERKEFTVYKNCKPLQPADLKKETLHNATVVNAIQKLVDSKELSRARADDISRRILETMGHTYSLHAVRYVACAAKVVLQRMYNAVYVNEARIGQLQKLCTESPVIFMPTHKTYMDFVLMQFLCFHYNLPLPAVASAQDFLQMNMMSELMRKMGAYFIRRSFNDDPLYKAIFNVYVQTQLQNGDRTMEAFIEGTRSRTGKSLHPKFGFLSSVCEPFLAARIFDFHIVPVSITFDRILEETLYGYEMLGYAKPKESTSALFKARSILNTNHGDAFVNFGQPISVRDFFTAEKIDRSIHHSIPIDQFSLSDQEQKAIKRLAYQIIENQQQNLIVDCWPLACLEIGRLIAYDENAKYTGAPIIDFDQVEKKVVQLCDLAGRLGCNVQSKIDDADISQELQHAFEMHSNLVKLDKSTNQLHIQSCHSKSVDTDKGVTHVLKMILHVAVNRLMLAHYANQCIHIFVPYCYLSSSFHSSRSKTTTLANLKKNFTFLHRLLAREFVNNVEQCEFQFENAVKTAQEAGILSISSDQEVKIDRWDDVQSLKFMLEPYLINYYMSIDCLGAVKGSTMTSNEFLKTLQTGTLTRLNPQMFNVAENFTAQNSTLMPSWYQILSIDTSKNCLHSLVDFGIVKRRAGDLVDPTTFQVTSGATGLSNLKNHLGSLLKNFYDTQTVDTVAKETADHTDHDDDVQNTRLKLKAKL